jgi:protein-disulfide isomerase
MRKIIYILLFFFLSINSFANENYKLSDITEGNENAKIKIYSYQSLTCPHCAVFHAKIYPLLKKDYIDTGIVKIYFKHFPLDLAALNAAKIAQCINKEKRLSFLDHLYKTQENWTRGEKIEDINQNLKKSVKQFGLSEDDFDKCLVFEDIENYILNSRIEGVKKFKIKSTPTIIINDEIFKDTLEYKNLKRVLEKLI